MRLIKRIQIHGLRSVENQNLDSVGDLTVFVGKNSSGKSNILRALNLFFNGEVEPGKPLNFAKDYFERVPRSRTKKRILISIDFELPATFHLRKELSRLTFVGSSFTITRTWELNQLRIPFDKVWIESNGKQIPDSEAPARQLLSLIFYRYIPNRSIPSELLKEESQEIANSILLRMKGDTHGAALLEQLVAATKRMLETASNSLESSGSPLVTPTLATPGSIGEMLTMTGFVARGSHGGNVQDEDWGSGHQAFFLYQVLHSLDTDYGRFFGWRQATIWGVEEPESALHRDLESRLAGELRDWSRDNKSRLQIIQTTHSPILTMASDVGYWTELEDGATKVTQLEIQALTLAAEQRGVSEWVHPLLSFPWNPIVLLEGDIDVEALTHVATVAGFTQFRFFTVPNLDRSESGSGKDGMISYLKRNVGLAQNRPAKAPLIVLFDWEISEQDVKKAKTAYGPTADRYVLKMDASHCHEKLGTDFRGVERFYPPSIIEESFKNKELALGVLPGKPFSISKAQLDGAKGALLRRFKKEISRDKLAPLIRVLIDLERAVRGESSVQITLPGIEDLPA